MHPFLLIWLLSLFTPSLQIADFQTFRMRGFTQGTSYQITYYATEKAVSKAQVELILAAIDSSLSIYKPYSLISRFNQSASGLKMDKHLARVVSQSLMISEKTGAAFDISIQPLVQAWGFGTETPGHLPDSATVQSLLACVGPEKIRIRQNYLHKEAPCVRIDVNGIAQGYTVDVLAEYLEAQGIENYLVEIGGEIRIKGRKQPGGELMAVGIEGPGGDEGNPFPIQTVIRLDHGAITSSGNYRKYYQKGADKISHLIDPKTGYPLRNEMISVCVWAKDAMSADGYDNALMGMGLKKALKFVAQQSELEAFFIYQKENGSVADTATVGFYKMME